MAALAIPDPSQGPLTAGIAGIDLGLSLASRVVHVFICQRITRAPHASPTPPLPLTLRRMVPPVLTQVGAPTCGGEVEVEALGGAPKKNGHAGERLTARRPT
jgi:hypothetical protein